jgi:serine/threonine protein kinase
VVPGAAPAEEKLPRQFGKYTLMRRIAVGGMAEIFLALHRAVAGFEKLVVIKRILPAMNKDAAFIDMLLHEARVAATFNHPNIVQTFDVGQVDGTYFLAMEHIHGEDVRAIVRAMRPKGLVEFPLEHALSIARGTCAALSYAHEKRDLEGRLLGIVHRDISPQNVLVTYTGDVKVVDFGVAKSAQASEDAKAGQLKGKIPYMSPEQAQAQPLDHRSDLFAVGILLFELTTGRRLFKGANDLETLELIVHHDYPRPSSLVPGYPAELERIVLRALEKDREKRYQNAREFQSDLETFIRDQRIPASQVALAKWMEHLFDDKLAAHKETLQDIKVLADELGTSADFTFPGQTGVTGLTSLTSLTGVAGASVEASAAPVTPPKRSSAPLLAALLLAGAGVGAWLALGRTTPAPAPATAAAPVEAPAAVKGTLEVVSDPPGAAIWIDGDLRPEKTPAKIAGLPLDQDIGIKLTQDEREPFKTTVRFSSSELEKKVTGELRTGSVTVTLKVEPPPTVWVDGKPAKLDGGVIRGLSADEEHKLVLSAPGYVPKTIVFTPKRGEAKVIEERLVKADPAQVAALAAQTAQTAPQATSQPSAAPTAAPTAAPASGPGKVRVGAKGGYCNVSINGSSYGPTPVEATVTGGRANVTCRTTDGKTLQQSVAVEPGGTARVSFKVD